MSKYGNAYYHARLHCIHLKWPMFRADSCSLVIDENVQLSVAQKSHRKRVWCFSVTGYVFVFFVYRFIALSFVVLVYLHIIFTVVLLFLPDYIIDLHETGVQ